MTQVNKKQNKTVWSVNPVKDISSKPKIVGLILFYFMYLFMFVFIKWVVSETKQ